MTIDAGSGYAIEVETSEAGGTTWAVRLYKKRLIGRKRISSDWFLEENQARRFAEELAADLRNGISTDQIIGRQPGWTLHRSSR